MALWGLKDSKSVSGTVSASGATVTGDSTDFVNEVAIGDYLAIGAVEGRVVAITNSTSLTVHESLGSVAANSSYIVSEKPKYTDAFSESVFGVDVTNEMAAAKGDGHGGFHAGWVQKRTKTRGGSTYPVYETLVATSGITGDAENSEFPNS